MNALLVQPYDNDEAAPAIELLYPQTYLWWHLHITFFIALLSGIDSDREDDK